jgi:hypothetical protein
MKPTQRRELQAKALDRIVAELEKAIAHAKVGAVHFRSGEVPRGCAHALAVDGHIQIANEALSQLAQRHRLAAAPVI